jgi:hypothetical protein
MESPIRFTDPYGAPCIVEHTRDGNIVFGTQEIMVSGGGTTGEPEEFDASFSSVEITREDLSRILPVLIQFVSTGKWAPSLVKRV